MTTAVWPATSSATSPAISPATWTEVADIPEIETETSESPDTSIGELAMWVAQFGFGEVEIYIADLVAALRRRGASGVALDVLADCTEPDIARARAFGRVAGMARTLPGTPG
jgi:sugar phosphate isomerase/epimerase